MKHSWGDLYIVENADVNEQRKPVSLECLPLRDVLLSPSIKLLIGPMRIRRRPSSRRPRATI